MFFHSQPALCNEVLAKGGKVVITRPEVLVNRLLWLLDSRHLIAEDVQIKAHNGLPARDLLAAFAEHGGAAW